jgi:hypothetical protein
MNTSPGQRSCFPFYLQPGPDETLLKWIGEWLKERRGNKSIAAVAKRAKVPPEQVGQIEQGVISVCLGQLRQLLRHGYGCSLEEVLAKCYEAFRDRLDKRRNRPFVRDYHYSFCRLTEGAKDATPMLIGGSPEKFLWAVPFRKLKHQPLVTELLELASARVKKASGFTLENSHTGVEVIFVVHGTVIVNIEGGKEGSYSRTLKREDAIHFNASFTHQIKNGSNTTSALLFIVRLQEIP